MTDPIQKHLADFRQQSRMKAGSLIISFFGDAVLPRGGRIWLGSLIGLLKPLELNERLIRTAIFRLVKEEWMVAQTIGRRANYMLTPDGQRRFEATARQIYAANSPLWDRRWRLILTIGELTAKQRERLRRALFWQGFGMVGSDCFIHPSTPLTAAFDALITDDMSDILKHLAPLIAAHADSDLSSSDTDIVNNAWDLAQLGASYTDFVSRYQPMLDQLRRSAQDALDDESAFLLRTLLIHEYRRLVLRDPDLPDVLLPSDWPGQRARLLTKELYRRLLAPSERHIELHMKLADGTTPAALPMLAQRFQVIDPLQPQV